MKFAVIFKKTFLDLLTLKKTLIYLGIAMLVPVIFSLVQRAEKVIDLANSSLLMQFQTLLGMLSIFTFLWIAGLPIIMLTVLICGNFIAKEDKEELKEAMLKMK